MRHSASITNCHTITSTPQLDTCTRQTADAYTPQADIRFQGAGVACLAMTRLSTCPAPTVYPMPVDGWELAAMATESDTATVAIMAVTADFEVPA